MGILDIIITILLLIGIVRGFIRGFIFEIAILGVLFVCYFLGFKIADVVAGWIGKIFSSNASSVHYVSLLISWIGISVGVYFLAKLFEGLVNIAALGIFNKIAGAIFGGFKVAFLLSLFFFFFNKINFSSSWINADAKAESHFYYPLLKISTAVFSSLENYGQ
jgi:membrane protein required for colicin V production